MSFSSDELTVIVHTVFLTARTSCAHAAASNAVSRRSFKEQDMERHPYKTGASIARAPCLGTGVRSVAGILGPKPHFCGVAAHMACGRGSPIGCRVPT